MWNNGLLSLVPVANSHWEIRRGDDVLVRECCLTRAICIYKEMKDEFQEGKEVAE